MEARCREKIQHMHTEPSGISCLKQTPALALPRMRVFFQAQTSWKLGLTDIKNQESLGWKTAGALCSADTYCGF